MECPFLIGNYMLSCGATRDVYVPSNWEFADYCKNTQHTICPFYRRADRLSRGLAFPERLQRTGR